MWRVVLPAQHNRAAEPRFFLFFLFFFFRLSVFLQHPNGMMLSRCRIRKPCPKRHTVSDSCEFCRLFPNLNQQQLVEGGGKRGLISMPSNIFDGVTRMLHRTCERQKTTKLIDGAMHVAAAPVSPRGKEGV